MSTSPPPPSRKPPLPHHRVRSVSGDSFAKQQQRSQHHGSSSSSSDIAERAELGLLSSLEFRRAHVKTPSGDVWYSAIEGERPPLAAVSHAGAATLERNGSNVTQDDTTTTNSSNGGGAAHWRDLARRVVEMNRSTSAVSNDSNGSSNKNNNNSNNRQQHKRGASRAHVMLGMIQEDAEEGGEQSSSDGNRVGQEDSSKNNATTSDSAATGIFENVGEDARFVNELFEAIAESPLDDNLVAKKASEEEKDANDVGQNSVDHTAITDSNSDSSETVPLRANHNNSFYGSSSSSANKRLARKKKTSKFQKFRERLIAFLDPARLGEALMRTLEQAYFFLVSIPIFFFSWVLVFYMDDPSFHFLPGNASLAWWVNLIGRLCLTLEMARIVQWVLIDNVILGTRTAARWLGPLLTLIAIQGRGWPFVVTTWSVINLFLLHGTHKFQKSWLLFVTFGFDNDGDEDSVNIIETGEYVRLWMALIVAGIVTSAKRTVVALHFGRRTFIEFKPRLEKLLREVVLVSEVSELALEIHTNVDHDLGDTLEVEVTGADRKVKFLGDISWSSDPRLENRTRTDSQLESDDESEASELKQMHSEQATHPKNRHRRNSSKVIPYKDLLEYWEEPVNKLDRSMNASIQDILKFRRALTFMDEPYPFGEAFGPATTRDEVLESASETYQRMLTNPTQSILNCDVLYLLAEDDDGITVDKAKKRMIRKLFCPDAANDVSMLSFVQACDSLYRRMRYFRASVGNASVIDNALESILDCLYNFILCLVILSILQINPWPLLVSISTMLVSISFAVGTSAAKYIEGILLIAVRRPFDLGDRIYLHEPSVWNNTNGIDCSWFVEDINLFNTTIRYAGTNEVATLSNGSIAHMRIVNGNRSPNAIVWFQLPFNLSILEEDKMSSLRAFLEAYAKLRPDKWHSCSYCRADEFYPDIEKTIITIGFQARSSWQDLSGIYTAKSELVAAIVDYGNRQAINYEQLPERQLHYNAGTLQKGAGFKHRDQLHAADNIVSDLDRASMRSPEHQSATPDTKPNSSSNEAPLIPGENVEGGDLSPDALFLSRLHESH